MENGQSGTILQVSNYLYASHPAEHTLNLAFWKAVRNRMGPLHIVGRGRVSKRVTTTRDEITYTLFPERGGRLRFIAELALWLKKIPTPSLYWVSDAVVSNLAVGPVARKRLAPYLVELQGDFFSGTSGRKLRQRLVRTFAMRAARGSTAVRVCNRHHAERLVRTGLPSDKVVVIPTRVDTALFDPEQYSKNEAREKLGLPMESILLVAVGNLIPGKGFAHAIKALAQLPKEVMLVLAGNGPEQRSLRCLASSLGSGKRLIMPGHIQHSEIPLILAACDIFVFPSYSEGMPRAVNEAQAMRLPVVATALDGISEQVVHGETGFLVHPGDTNAIIRSLRTLIENSHIRDRFGRAGRDRVSRLFAFDTVMDQWEQLLRSCMGKFHVLH